MLLNQTFFVAFFATTQSQVEDMLLRLRSLLRYEECGLLYSILILFSFLNCVLTA